MSDYFLPAGLLLAFLVAWFAPGPGAVMEQLGLIPWMVVTIFLVNGYQARLDQLPAGRNILAASLVAVPVSLLVSPFIGLAAANLAGLPAAATLGVVVMATVPPTLSSGIVMTGIAGGNVPKALFLTILLNLLGVFSIPFMLQLTLDRVGIVAISPWPLLQKLALIVLIPFLAGILLKRAVSLPPRHPVLRYLPSTCVIGTVWMAVSASVDTLRDLDLSLLLSIAAAATLVHLALLLLCWLARGLYRPPRGEWIALLFTTSQKTLPVAIGVLAALDHPAGVALVACILFHFLQLFIDSVLASRIGR